MIWESASGLMDIVYQQDFTSIDSGLLRIDNLLKRISDDFPIVRKKAYYFFKENLKRFIFCQWNSASLVPSAFLKRSMPEFTRGDVERVFQVTSSTANRWILDWTEAGLIKSADNQNQSKYGFI